MSLLCTTCGHSNREVARFCAMCGRAVRLVAPAAPAVRRTRSRGRRAVVGLVLAAMALPVGLRLIGMVAGHHHPSRVRSLSHPPMPRFADITRPSAATAHRRYELTQDKAMALYDLLAPDDVPVRVQRYFSAVSIEGTPSQVQAIDRLVEMLRRNQSYRGEALDWIMTDQQRTWVRGEPIRLPRDRARRLYDLLALPDVPVGVCEHGGELRIAAAPGDLEVIEAFVRIVRGR